MPRIVSFLPAATEIAYAIGAGADLVGRSHECDYPADALRLPVVSRPALPVGEMTQSEVDRAVAAQLAGGESLYQVDEVLLRRLQPDVVLTQDLCQVCAPSGTELTRALRDLPSKPEVLWLTPRTIAEIDQNILDIGRVTGRLLEAESVIADSHERIEWVGRAVAGAHPRRVAFLEWTDPFFCAGHWVPEMIALAGGIDPLGQAGGDSRRITWDAVAAESPEIIVVAPCGYGLANAQEAAESIRQLPGSRVVAVDANAYFARPGPRVAEAIELLAHLFHPSLFSWPHASRPWSEVSSPSRNSRPLPGRV
jgi:iron complex transport system substrate-binding protein